MRYRKREEDPLPLFSPLSLLQIPSKDFSAAAVSIARTMVSIIEPITRYPQKSAFRPPPSAGLRKNPEFITFVDDVESEVLALKHESMILGQWSNPVSGSRKSQASSPWAKQQSRTCSIMGKQHTGLGKCQRFLLSCFRAI